MGIRARVAWLVAALLSAPVFSAALVARDVRRARATIEERIHPQARALSLAIEHDELDSSIALAGRNPKPGSE